MKIKDIALSAAYVGQRVVKAICVGAQEVWSAVKYIVFKDPVVAQICATNFGDGSGLTEEDAAKVTDIGTIFQGNTEITSFDELNKFGVTELKTNAFKGCTNLAEIGLENITKMNDDVFKDCSSLAIDVNMPNLKEFGGIFNTPFTRSGIVSISNLGAIPYLPSNYDGGGFAEGCTSLIKVVLPPTCKTIGNGTEIYCMYAFRGCTALREVVGIEQLEFIAQGTFANCTSLDIPVLSSLNIRDIRGGAFSGAKVHKIDLPNVRRLEGAFSNCSLSGDINLPSLEVLTGAAFLGNDILTVSNLGTAKSVGTQCFEANKNLTSVILPSTLQTIGERAFRECEKLPAIDIPSGVTSIGNLAFQYCTGLKTIICNPTTPPSINENSLWTTPSDMSIYVPDQSVQAYREASGWLSYANQILPMEAYLYGIITFADPAVEAICLANWDTNGSGYLNKEEAKAVTSLGTVFKGNTEITSFNELEFFGITRINTNSFASCTNLSEITIPNSVTTIDNEAMWLSPNLKVNNLSSNANIVKISDWAFYNTQACRNLHLENLTTLGLSAFKNSELSGTVNLPKLNSVLSDQFGATKVERLENLGFMTGSSSSNLTSMTELVFARFPKTFKAAANDFLSGCTKLKTLILESEEVVKAGTWPTISTNVAADGIYVPDNLVDAYKTSDIWKWRANYIKPLSQYVES